MSNDYYDVIVIGAGPAGSTCAYLLGKKVNVALIDKAKFPRRKLCGGLLTFKTIEILERLFRKNPDKLKKMGIINFEANTYNFYLKLNKVYEGKSPYPFYFTDRIVYDHFLLNEAKDNSVTVIEECKVKSVQKSGEKINIIANKGRELSCKYLIGADGVVSIVRKSIFLKSNSLKSNQNKWRKELAVAFETFIKRKAINFSIPALFFSYVNYGYGWIFPNRDKLVVGMGALLKKNKNIRESFRRFLHDINLNYGKIYAHLVPLGCTITPADGNILLVGDSAGFVDSVTGEGIFYAHRSGEIAAYSVYQSLIKNERVDKLYIRLLNRYLYPELRRAKKLRSLLYLGTPHLNKGVNKILLKCFGDKIIKAVHGIKSYNYLRVTSIREPVWK